MTKPKRRCRSRGRGVWGGLLSRPGAILLALACAGGLAYACTNSPPDPPDEAAAIRAAVDPNGTWFIVDLSGAPTFEENLANPQAAMLYAMSVLSCLSSGLSEPGGAGLGTLGLPEPAHAPERHAEADARAELARVGGGHPRLALAHEVAHVAHDLAGALRLFADFLERLHQLRYL